MADGRRESTYTVVAREVRNRILQGDYADGRRLPTEAELAERHGVSRQTVRRAFQDLVAEGMVYRVPGRGTFVTRREGRTCASSGRSTTSWGCRWTPGWTSPRRCAGWST